MIHGHAKTDDDYQRRRRDEMLKPFYQKFGHESRFVFMDKGKLSERLQKEAIDTILQKEGNNIITIEEKIVRWPGYLYEKICLEFWSCTNKGYERPGWMAYGQCDFLFYCLTLSDGISALGYLMPFKKLQNWFFENNRFARYPVWVSDQFNHTECRLVSIQDVLNDIPETEVFILEGK